MHTVRIWIAITTALLASACAATTPQPAAERAAPLDPPQAPPPSAAQPAPAATIALPNAAQPLPGVLTGGQPTEADLRVAQQAGYRTVISLLPVAKSSAEGEQARSLGLHFVSIPITGPVDLTADNVRALSNAMDAPGAKPLILHCASGNRAGALLALKAFQIDGMSREAALELGVKAGLTSLKPVVEAKLASPERQSP